MKKRSKTWGATFQIKSRSFWDWGWPPPACGGVGAVAGLVRTPRVPTTPSLQHAPVECRRRVPATFLSFLPDPADLPAIIFYSAWCSAYVNWMWLSRSRTDNSQWWVLQPYIRKTLKRGITLYFLYLQKKSSIKNILKSKLYWHDYKNY